MRSKGDAELQAFSDAQSIVGPSTPESTTSWELTYCFTESHALNRRAKLRRQLSALRVLARHVGLGCPLLAVLCFVKRSSKQSTIPRAATHILRCSALLCKLERGARRLW